MRFIQCFREPIVSDQTREKEKDLAELMVRILKEPLRPLGESVKGLERELFDIKAEIDLVSGTVADCLTHSDKAAKCSKDASELLGKLRNEQAEWEGTLQAILAEHARVAAQTDARLGEGFKAVVQSEHRVLDAVASVCEAQLNTAQILASINSTAEHTKELMAENLQAGQVLHDSLTSGQAEIIRALNHHVEALSARVDQGQAKLRRLTITTGVFSSSMLAYVGYELLSRFI